MEKLKVGICGWGNVATGLFKALNGNADMITVNACIYSDHICITV